VSVTNPTTETEAEPEAAADEKVESGAGLAILGLLVVGGIALAAATDSLFVVLFIVGIVAMVTLHEAGHYVVAKWAGMKVTQFFFGFGPRLWSFRRGETEYGVKALPLGGYVKIIGMSNLERDIDPADEPRTYRQQSYPKRVAVALAGVVTHFVVAFLVLMLILTVLGLQNGNKATLDVGSITAESAAQRAGLQVGDRLVSVDGRPINRWEDLPPYIKARPGLPLAMVVERDGRQVPITATPDAVDQEGQEGKVGFLGVGPEFAVERAGVLNAMGRSARMVGDLTVGAVEQLGAFFAPGSLKKYAGNVTGSTTGAEADSRPVSVVGAVRLADQAADYDWRWALELFVILNIFIAVLNLIPLLPFDGGHVAVATYERIRSRKGRRYQADVGKMMPVTAAVVGVFLLLGVTSIWLDIVNPVSNPFQ
jgi:membrane-associated protease RseP (regulator of RpoE activity)